MTGMYRHTSLHNQHIYKAYLPYKGGDHALKKNWVCTPYALLYDMIAIAIPNTLEHVSIQFTDDLCLQAYVCMWYKQVAINLSESIIGILHQFIVYIQRQQARG